MNFFHKSLIVIQLAAITSCMKRESIFLPTERLPNFSGMSKVDLDILTNLIDSVVEMEDSQVFVHSNLYVIFLCGNSEMDVNGESMPSGVLVSVIGDGHHTYVASPNTSGIWLSAEIRDDQLAVREIANLIKNQKLKK